MEPHFSPRDFLFTLLLKVGVAASIGALLARWNTLRRVLFTEERDVDQKIKLMLFTVPPLILGVTLRLVGAQYRFADLSLEGAFLMGLLGGRVVGPIGGAIITIPTLIAREWLGMPAAAAALMSFSASPIMTDRAGSKPHSASARSMSPGAGFRQ